MTGFEGTRALVRLALRRDRVRLPTWVLTLVALTGITGAAVGRAYPDQRAIDAYAASLSSAPSAVAMAGPPIALDTHAGVVIYESLLTVTVGVVLMTVFLVIRHTRAEEEAGRTELLGATRVGRFAGATAAMLVAVLAAVLLGAGVAAAEAAVGVPVGAAVLLGASVTALGTVFGALTLCLAQLFTHARTTLGAALGLLGIAFVLRAAGDVRKDGLIWLSPIGWSQATHPLGENRWWPLAVSASGTLVLLVIAAVLVSHRDVGGGLIATRDGSPTAAGWLRGPVGLALVLQRSTLLAWTAGMLVLATLTGTLSRAMEDLARGNPLLEEYFLQTGRGTLTDSFLSVMLLILALLTSGFALSSALRLRAEESAGRLEPLLAAGLTRTRWALGTLVVTLTGSVLVLVAAGVGLGLGYGLSVSDPGQALRFGVLVLVYAPAVLVLAATAVLLVGWLPGVAWASWALLVFCFVLGWLGTLLRPPRWVEELSPFTHVPAVPVEAVGVAPATLTLLAVVLLVGGGLLGLRRRDIG